MSLCSIESPHTLNTQGFWFILTYNNNATSSWAWTLHVNQHVECRFMTVWAVVTSYSIPFPEKSKSQIKMSEPLLNHCIPLVPKQRQFKSQIKQCFVLFFFTSNLASFWNNGILFHTTSTIWLRTSVPVQETLEAWVWSLGLDDPLEKEMATHSGILAWEIPWTKKPGGLLSLGSQRVGHD